MIEISQQQQHEADDSLEISPLYLEANDSRHDGRHHRPWTAKRSAGLALRTALRYSPLLLNIAAWYFSNGMHGIAMQSFSKSIVLGTRNNLAVTAAITSMISSLQLLLGALLGFIMISIFSTFVSADPTRRVSFRRSETYLAVLHGIGSVCTNLGFMYGSASLIQIIKLLEPFETLFLTKILMPAAESNRLSLGVVCSTTFTVGAAISLIQNRTTPPQAHAVFFAVSSGITLSSRNVLQRRQHLDNSATCESKLSQAYKLERSLLQFIHLSLQSGVAIGVASVLLNVHLFNTDPDHLESVVVLLSHGINWRVLTWHPLYNAFSMIMLGFCSALTHSLLNAGKRVFAIGMAIVWFGESRSMATVASLGAVAIGGCWYAVESKANTKARQ